MPIYEYECESCGHRFEVWHGASEPGPDGCPKCGERVRKVYHPVGLIFKGSGFYVTDYKRKEEKKSRSSGSSSEEKEGGEKEEGELEEFGKEEPDFGEEFEPDLE